MKYAFGDDLVTDSVILSMEVKSNRSVVAFLLPSHIFSSPSKWNLSLQVIQWLLLFIKHNLQSSSQLIPNSSSIIILKLEVLPI